MAFPKGMLLSFKKKNKCWRNGRYVLIQLLNGKGVFPALSDQSMFMILRNLTRVSFPNNPMLPQLDSPCTRINVCEPQEIVFSEISRIYVVEGQAVCCPPLPRTI